MLRSILEYASAVWSPYTKQDINKVERVQRQSARFIMGNYSSYSSVSNMIEILYLQSLLKPLNVASNTASHCNLDSCSDLHTYF